MHKRALEVPQCNKHDARREPPKPAQHITWPSTTPNMLRRFPVAHLDDVGAVRIQVPQLAVVALVGPPEGVDPGGLRERRRKRCFRARG